MPNRSLENLPSFFDPAVPTVLDGAPREPMPLSVYEITYLHYHSLMEVALCASGSGVCVVEGVEYPFEAGDVQIVFPFQNHLSRSTGEEMSQWYWTSLDPLPLLGELGGEGLPRLEQLLYTKMGLCGIIDKNAQPLVCELVRRIALPGDKRMRVSCLLALIEVLAEESRGLPPLQLRPERRFTALEPALHHVERCLDEAALPRVEDMATLCRMPQATFRRAFHAALGRSPQQYVQACQLHRARQLLLFSEESVTNIALSVGYQDASGFNRLFGKAYGVTPREYRKAHKG